MGQLAESIGETGRPEYHLYRAASLERENLIPEALFELSEVERDGDPACRLVARDEIAQVARDYGRALYKAGAISEANKQWAAAIAARPDLVASHYMAGQGMYDTADYSRAIGHFESVLSLTTQPVLRANALSGIGDSHYKLGDVELARLSYLASRKAYDVENYRALKSLTSSYFR
jgi:tetratricopeptide (TPR) repeat protein